MRVLAAIVGWGLCAAAAAGPLVAVDVGHYLAEPGATSARGRPELAFNRDLAVEVAGALEAAGLRARVIGANGDLTVLSRRTAAAREADLFVSIHHDSVQPHYLEEWEHEGNRAPVQRPFRRVLPLRLAPQSGSPAEPRLRLVDRRAPARGGFRAVAVSRGAHSGRVEAVRRPGERRALLR